MQFVINNKGPEAFNEKDLEVLIDNADYRENEILDYKQTFSFLEYSKGKEREEKKAEFKNDICAFANADGGYLVYGICDKNGCATEITGIEIKDQDTDRFELDRRNDLNGILPKIPTLKFYFIPLSNSKYVVIIQVSHDGFAPYLHIFNEGNYKIYKRTGNGKKAVSYSELKQMFNQSLSLEKEIFQYRRERIDYYRENLLLGERFVLFNIIPEAFLDSSYSKNLFLLERAGKVKLSSLFSAFNCGTSSIPCVDGLRFIPYSDDIAKAECYVKNNGIIEGGFGLDERVHLEDPKYQNGFLPYGWLWDKIVEIIRKYTEIYTELPHGNRQFICLSLIGCKGMQTDNDFYHDFTGTIDRDEVLCEPAVWDKSSGNEDIEFFMKKMYISFLLAIGVKHNQTLSKLVKEVYGV